MKKNKFSKNWIIKQKRDIYIKQSKLEGYRSRAVYKLQEINEKFKILKNGISVVDLGAAPGSWSQFVVRKFKNIKIVSIDLNEIENIENIYQIKGDYTDEIQQIKIKQGTSRLGYKNIYSKDVYKSGVCVRAASFYFSSLDLLMLSLSH